ncbi:MAG: ATP-binding protein [Armatimonadia bacterium]
MSGFTRATKKKSKLRAAIFGPSGAGKTFTALRIAVGLGGRIAGIDTEFGSMSKYSDRFAFDVLELTESQAISDYTTGIDQAAAAGYDVLIIDSMTHGWQELLAEIDRLAKSKYGGNSWSAWSEGTPKQKALIKSILSFPGHIIATMRSKTEWESAKDDRGKVKPVRIGLAPDEGKGIEYEFDLLLELSTDHIATVIKDRTGKFQDLTIEKPGEDFGRALAAWLADGVPVPVATYTSPVPVEVQPPAASHSSKPVVFPFGKHKDAAPDSLTVEELRSEATFWERKTEEEKNPRFKANNERLLSAIKQAIADKTPAPTDPPPAPAPEAPAAEPSADLAYIQGAVKVGAVTEAQVTVYCHKKFARGLTELNAEELRGVRAWVDKE